MAQKKRTARAEVRSLTEFVKDAVDDSATAAEKIHKKVAGLPLDVLERIDAFEDTVHDVRKLQDRSIAAVYDLVRGINREVSRLAKDLLGRPRTRRAPASRKRASKAA